MLIFKIMQKLKVTFFLQQNKKSPKTPFFSRHLAKQKFYKEKKLFNRIFICKFKKLNLGKKLDLTK